MAEGITIESLLQSLSAAGSTSADLAALSLTAKSEQTRPLVDYSELSQHMFFGNGSKRYSAALSRIRTEYPIGLAGASVGSLGPADVYDVDKYIKESDGFDLWLLEELSKNDISDTKKYSITAGATNPQGEQVSLIHIVRDSSNNIQSPQSTIVSSLTDRINRYEELGLEYFETQSGTASFIDTSGTAVRGITDVFGISGEREIARYQQLDNLLPEVLFLGDDDEVLSRTLAAFAEQLDELRLFIDYMPYNRTISYDDYKRVPNQFLPVLAREFGIELFDSASNIDISRSLVNSASGGYTSKQITYEVWKRILNNVSHILKTKGTREAVESISRLYGVDRKFIKANEYSLFSGPVLVRNEEEVDVPCLYSDGTVYVATTVNSTTGSSLSFDFAASQDFTIESRVSLTSGTENTIIEHPLYSLKINNEGQATFSSVTTPTVTTTTPKSSISSYMAQQNSFVNVSASRSGDTLSVYVMALSGSPTGGNDIVVVSENSYNDPTVETESYDSTGGTVGGSTFFPSPSNFNGYISEVRTWDAALLDDDLKEHTKNFESVSIENSKNASTPVTYGNLQSHYKLKENTILKGQYNFIVNSATAGTTATPVGFSLTNKNYKVFSDIKKIINYYPAGLGVDNDRIRQDDVSSYQKDIGYISLSLNPIGVISDEIRNYISDINLYDLMGNTEDHTAKKYTSDFIIKWHEISSMWGLSTSYVSDDSSTGTSGNTYGISDTNTFIKALGNFNDTFGGLFSFVKQFIPARTNILSEGIFVEPHILERSKMRRVFGYRFNKLDVFTEDSLTADGNVFSLDEGSSAYNAIPNIVEQNNFELKISNKYTPGDLAINDSTSGNYVDLTASAATTATFQGFQYRENAVQDSLQSEINENSLLPNVTKNSSTNFPTFSSTRFGRFLPVKTSPASPEQSEVDITLDQLIISPIESATSSKGFISGRIKLIVNGKAFKTDSNSLKFEFPASADGTNLFIAEVGDIDAGEGRIIKEKDIGISIPLVKDEIQFKLTLADVVASLSAVDVPNGITQAIVDDSISGSIGIVPVKVTNLFNDLTYVFRVGINSDVNRDTDFIRQITQQGVEKVRT